MQALSDVKVLEFGGMLAGAVTTKHLALRELAPQQPIALIPGWLDLRYVTNTDTAFSLLGGWLVPSARFTLIVAVQAAIIGTLAVWTASRWRVSQRLERVASAIVIGGALGNLLDRSTNGHVVDFIHVSFWPVFNVADIAICAGVALMLLSARGDRHGARTRPGRS